MKNKIRVVRGGWIFTSNRSNRVGKTNKHPTLQSGRLKDKEEEGRKSNLICLSVRVCLCLHIDVCIYGNVVNVRRKKRDDGVVVVLSKVNIIIKGKEGGGYCLVVSGD